MKYFEILALKNILKDLESVVDYCKSCEFPKGRINDFTTVHCIQLWKGLLLQVALSAHCTQVDMKENNHVTKCSQDPFSYACRWRRFCILWMLQYVGKIRPPGKYNITFEWYEYDTTNAFIDSFDMSSK